MHYINKQFNSAVLITFNNANQTSIIINVKACMCTYVS